MDMAGGGEDMKSYWLNIPVKNVAASMEFFEKIGFEVNGGEDDTMAQVMVGDHPFLLFKDDVLHTFIGGNLADTNTGNEFVISFNMDTNEEVDDLCKDHTEWRMGVDRPRNHQGILRLPVYRSRRA